MVRPVNRVSDLFAGAYIWRCPMAYLPSIEKAPDRSPALSGRPLEHLRRINSKVDAGWWFILKRARVRTTALGLLHISCVSADPAVQRSWPLEFNVREHVQRVAGAPGAGRAREGPDGCQRSDRFRGGAGIGEQAAQAGSVAIDPIQTWAANLCWTTQPLMQMMW